MAQDSPIERITTTPSLRESHVGPALASSNAKQTNQLVQTGFTPHLPLRPAVSEVNPAQTVSPTLRTIHDSDAIEPTTVSAAKPQFAAITPGEADQPYQPLSHRETSVAYSTTALPAQPLLTIDQIAQVPEVPAPEESAGRRPSIRTQPTAPNEAPLDLRQEILTPKIIYSPSTTILTPSAYGKSWRQASVGFGFQHRTRFTDSADGAFGVGIGLGDARKYVGLDVGLTLTDLDAFDRGIISFKLHRRLPDLFAVAVGVNDAISWGPGDIDGPSPYGVVSKTFILKENTKDLFSRLYVSAGLGTGRYRTENNVFTGDDTPGVFGSVALRIADPVNAIAEWSGQDLSLGVSLRPFREIPLIFTPAITDVTGTAGDGVRFIFGIGYAITF